MNARPHRRAKPSRKRAWITLAVLSGSIGTLLVILAIAILSPRVGLRLEDGAQAIWPRVPMVTESPSAIMRWYHEFDGDAEAQAAAATQYYNLSLPEILLPVSSGGNLRWGTPRLPSRVAGIGCRLERDLQMPYGLCGQTHRGCLDGSGHVDTYGVMVAWPLGVGWTPFGDTNTVHKT
jgi:hypothetical protein